MMDYNDFYDLAEYCNEVWSKSWTQKEISNNAYKYLVAFEESNKQHEYTKTMLELLTRLKEDNRSESAEWVDLLSVYSDIDEFGKKEYEVRIVETYARNVRIRAIDEDDAYEQIDQKVGDGEIDLPKDGGTYAYDRELFVSEVKEKKEREVTK